MTYLQFIIGALLIVMGLIVFGLSVFGVFRFKYVLNRMHAAAMGDTLGILLTVAGLAVLSGFTAVTWKLVLVVIMLWLTSPVASHLIGRLETHTNKDISSMAKEVVHEMKHENGREAEK